MSSRTPQNSAEFESPVVPGELLAGKYRVERTLGVGGMGVVVAARHEQLDQLVALKFVLAGSDPAAVERFVREARAASRLRSEHVARVLDVGTLDSGTPYIVMEYLDGSDLSAVIRDRSPLSPEAAVDYVLQACEALSEAHGLGIIHRDLKPGNLFLTNRVDGRPLVKVLDFGISKTLSDGVNLQQLTRTNSAIGSPLYMAPEQMRSARNVDARSDVWALGVVLYELLSGLPPFKGNSIPEICLKAATDMPDPIGRSDVPTALEAVIEKCMAKDPAGRYAGVVELAAALAPYAPPGSVSAESCHKIALESRAKHERTVEAFITPQTARMNSSSFPMNQAPSNPAMRTPSNSQTPGNPAMHTPSNPAMQTPSNPAMRTPSGPPQATPAVWIHPGAPEPKPRRRSGNALTALMLFATVAAFVSGGIYVLQRNLTSNSQARGSATVTTADLTPVPMPTETATPLREDRPLAPLESATPPGPSALPAPAVSQKYPVARPATPSGTKIDTAGTVAPPVTAAPPKPAHQDDDIPSVR